jgi:Zn-dependent membrane protease YugP
VAAHERADRTACRGYQWLTMRSKLVPFVNVASSYMQWILIGGILLMNSFPQLLLIGIVLWQQQSFH